MLVLVKSDLATPTLREEGVRHARELGAAKSVGPVAVSRDVEELKLDVDLEEKETACGAEENKEGKEEETKYFS